MKLKMKYQLLYQDIVSDNLKMAEDIKSDTLVENRNIKDLQDAENMKKLKEGEDKKIRVNALLHRYYRYK